MINRGTMAFVVCTLFALVPPLMGQKEPDQEPRIRVWAPRRLSLISVDLWLYSSKDPLFVPYCGTDESGRPYLCTLGAHLEKMTPQGWRKAQIRGGDLTGISLLSAHGELILPRDRASFTFIFDYDLFGIPPGTRLRVVVDAWPSKESLESGAPPTEVTSPEFVCPRE
jgi:hypothetical protein